MTTITNPMIPYSMSLPGGRLQAGSFVIVQGQPLFSCNKFTINFLNQATKKCVFHFDVRFNEGQTVRNTNYPSNWGREERSSLPFAKNRHFVIEFRCMPDRFMVAVDGNHYCEYVHRVSHTEADAFEITGEVQINLIEFKNANYFPSFPSGNRLNVTNPPVPFSSLINGQLAVGNEIQVHGRVNPYPNRFSVNLQQGSQSYPQPTIAFHFNPRYEGGNRTIVMNSWMGSWGQEQRMPVPRNLLPGNNFVLIIRRQPSYFEVLVNGTRIITYNHRMNADMIDSVAIDGDVSLSKVVAI